MALEAVLVLTFLLFPGLVADAVYRFLAWRPDPSDQGLLIRATVISAVSLFAIVLGAAIAPAIIAPPPYLNPQWWRLEDGILPWADALPAWALHTVVALVGVLLAGLVLRTEWATRAARRLFRRSLFSSAWDEFAAESIGEWVLVRCRNGEQFYGYLGTVSGDRRRDLVLYRPASYDPASGSYEISGHRAIFIQESEVERVLVPLVGDELEHARQLFGRYDLQTGDRVNGQEERTDTGGAEADARTDA